MARRKLRRGSVLGDMQMGGEFGGRAPAWQPAPVDRSGVGVIISPVLSPGVATEIARSVQQIPFDDSIDGTYPLECFFQMPPGVVQVRSVKVWVTRKPFRRYVSAVSSSATGGGGVTSSSSGGSSQTSSAATGHSHAIQLSGTSTTTSSTGLQIVAGGSSAAGSSTATGGTTDAQGVHNHSDPQGGATGDAGSHSHNVNFSHSHTTNISHSHTTSETAHGHGYLTAFSGTTDSGGSHSHTLDTTHSHNTDTTHNHTITTTLTAGIYEEALTGTVSLYAANDGITFAGPIVTGQTIISGLDITSYFSKAPGDRRIRVNGTALMRVQVLLVVDLILELGI